MDLIAEGRKRFEVLELNQERSFLRAEVLLMPDEPDSVVEEQKLGQFGCIWKLCRSREPCRIFPQPIRLSFPSFLPDRCHFDLDFKQKLLGDPI